VNKRKNSKRKKEGGEGKKKTVKKRWRKKEKKVMHRDPESNGLPTENQREKFDTVSGCAPALSGLPSPTFLTSLHSPVQWWFNQKKNRCNDVERPDPESNGLPHNFTTSGLYLEGAHQRYQVFLPQF
jgi:hypothetical protein